MSALNNIHEGFHSITHYLTMKNANAAIQFYRQAFGAREARRISKPDGTVGHAELEIGDSRFMLAEEMPAWGNKSPATLGGTPVGIALYVANVDAGATVIEQVKDQFFGDHSGSLSDPFGHKWHVMTHIEDVSFPEMQRRCDVMFSAKS